MNKIFSILLFMLFSYSFANNLETDYVITYQTNFSNGLMIKEKALNEFGLNQLYVGKIVSTEKGGIGASLGFDFNASLPLIKFDTYIGNVLRYGGGVYSAIASYNGVLISGVFGKTGISYGLISLLVVLPIDLQYSISGSSESSEHNSISINPGLQMSIRI